MATFNAAGVQVELELSPFGDRAVIVREPVSRGADGWRTMAAAARVMQAGKPDWITDVVPAFDTVTVVYDPCLVAAGGGDVYDAAASAIARLLRDQAGNESGLIGRMVEIPVCYGGAFGPDLADCANRAGVSPAAFAEAHAEAVYEVAMVGFMPGFPYLSGLPRQLAQPRRGTPRSRVAAGSVGIAGGQTGIYPFESPGGWQLIGRTPIRLFRPEREDEPVPFRAGDRVRFYPIDSADFEANGEEAP